MDKLNQKDIELIIKSGRILKETLKLVCQNLKPGVSGKYLDKIAEENIRSHGAKPSFKEYSSGGNKPFPASLCVSINENIVHGIPKEDQIIRDGDIVSLDLGVNYKGLCTDSAVTVIAGKEKNPNHKKLINATRESLYQGIKRVKAGAFTGDIGNAVESYVNKAGFNVVKSLVGHGIGHEPHEEPQIPNFGAPGSGTELEDNTAIAIEPMVVAGGNDLRTDKDGWTIKTADNSFTAHFEHTVIVKKDGCKIIT